MKADDKRSKPYVWVTWITKFLAGEDKCEWKNWYKANFRYAKRDEPEFPALKRWIRQHDEMTSIRKADLESEGWMVATEEANAFKLDGKQATLSGKPDIVATKPDEKLLLVVDEKSGKKRNSDRWQVLTYMFALPLAFSRFSSWAISGAVDYRNGLMEISNLEDEHVERISGAITTISSEEEPARTPSVHECRFCNILNCPDRADAGDGGRGDASNFF